MPRGTGLFVTAQQVKQMQDMYGAGWRIKDIAEQMNISVGKTYYLLRDSGVVFRRSRGWNQSEEAKRKISAALKGRVISDEARRKESETKRCHYNGLNGYGHYKPHASGYIRVYVPDHPRASSDGYVFEHTVVMERAIGRYLNQDEVVHHINRIKSDNRLENLVLMNRHEHQSMHMRERMAKRRNGLW